MMREKIKKTKLRHIGMLFAFVFLFSLIGFTAVGTVDVITTYADDEEDVPSFSSMSQAASEYLSLSLMPSHGNQVKKLPRAETGQDWANVGGMVGYIDQDSSVGQWLTSWLTTASSKVGYTTYKGIKDADGNSNDTLFYYVQYGAALRAMGLDSTGTEGSGKIARAAGGWILYGLYTLSGFVPTMFKVVIDALIVLNPFQVFSVSSMTNILKPTSTVTSGVMYNIGNTMADFYSTLAEYGWTICAPIFLAALILEIYLFKKTKPSSAVKKFIIRICAIGMGIPLLGATYTEMLNMLDASLDTGNSASTLVVTSILVDFENWAENYRLDWISGSPALRVKSDVNAGTVELTSTSIYNQRKICFDINKASNRDLGLDGYTGISGTYSMSSALDWNSDLYANANSASTSSFSACQSLIKRYCNGDTYTSADWESRVKAATSAEDIEKEMKASDTEEEVEQYGNMFVELNVDSSSVEGLSASTANIWGMGRIDCVKTSSSDEGDYYSYSHSSSSNVGSSDKEGYRTTGGGQGGLSVMSLYNYLNTSFGSGSLITYSTTDSTSLFTREQHYSVNLVGGDGFLSFAYWLNAVSLLLSFTVIGFVYAIGMIFYIISRSIRMLTAIPGMLLGSIKSFGKVIVYTICMILQVLVTMIMYEITTMMLFQVNSIITIPIASNVNTSATIMIGNVSVVVPASASVALLGGLLILGSVLQLLFVFFAIKERKTVLKGFNEAAEQIIDKLLDTNAAADNSSTLAQKAAGAVGGAVGMAAGAKLAGAHSSGSSKNAEKGDSLEDTKNPEDDSAGTGGGDETPDATGSGGSDNDGTGSGGIEGEDAAMKAEQKQLEDKNSDQKKLEDKKDAEANSDSNENENGEASNESDSSSSEDGQDVSSDDGSSDVSEDGEVNGPATDEEIAAEATDADSLADMSDTSDGDSNDSSDSSADVGSDAGDVQGEAPATGDTAQSGSPSGTGDDKSTPAGEAGKAAANEHKNQAQKAADKANADAGKSGSTGDKQDTKGVQASIDQKSGGHSAAYEQAKAQAEARKSQAQNRLNDANAKSGNTENSVGKSGGAKSVATSESSGGSSNSSGSQQKQPSVARQTISNMAASAVASGVASALGADAQTAAQAGQMAMMGSMMNQNNSNGVGSSNSPAPSGPAVGGSGGGTSSPAPVRTGGSAAPAARSGGVSTAPSPAMPGGGSAPVINSTGGSAVVNTSASSNLVSNSGATNVTVNSGGGNGPVASNPGAPMVAKVGSSGPQVSGHSAVPSGGSSGVGMDQGAIGSGMTAAEAAEIAQINREALQLEKQARIALRSKSAIGRTINSIQAAPGAAAATVVGGVNTAVNGVKSATNTVITGVTDVAHDVKSYSQSSARSKAMKQQTKELDQYVKYEAKKAKRIEKATKGVKGDYIQ